MKMKCRQIEEEHSKGKQNKAKNKKKKIKIRTIVFFISHEGISTAAEPQKQQKRKKQHEC
jgi:hypothetical protein